MALVESYVDSGIAVITLNDSEHGNRLNADSLQVMSHNLNSALLNDEVRVVLIRSNGENFCLGMDLDFLICQQGNRDTAEMAVEQYVALLLKIYEAPKPVVALINGKVKAGGMGLVGACDIIVASQESSFELSEVLLGLIPANVLPFIYGLRITPQKARYLILTARCLNASEAKETGLVDEVFPADQLEKGIKGILKNLFRASPKAIAHTKHFTQAILSLNMDQATNLAKEKLLELIGNPEVLAGVQAFNEGGTPPWFGKCRPEKPLTGE